MPGKKPLFSQKMVNPRSGTVRFSTGEARQGSWLVERQAGGARQRPAARTRRFPAIVSQLRKRENSEVRLTRIVVGTNISDFRNCEKVNMWGEEVSVTLGLAHPDPQRPLAGRMSPEDPYPMLARTRRGRVAFGCSRWGHGDSTRRACRGPSRVTTQAFSTSRPRSASPPTATTSTIRRRPAASTSAA